MDINLKRKIHSMCVWSGMGFAILVLIGLAKLLPPVAPSLTVVEVVEMYKQNATSIRVGMIVLMFAAALYLPFTAVAAYFISALKVALGCSV